jgi:hypothetical protein
MELGKLNLFKRLKNITGAYEKSSVEIHLIRENITPAYGTGGIKSGNSPLTSPHFFAHSRSGTHPYPSQNSKHRANAANKNRLILKKYIVFTKIHPWKFEFFPRVAGKRLNPPPIRAGWIFWNSNKNIGELRDRTGKMFFIKQKPPKSIFLESKTS